MCFHLALPRRHLSITHLSGSLNTVLILCYHPENQQPRIPEVYDGEGNQLTRPQIRAIRLDCRVQVEELRHLQRVPLEHVRARLALDDVDVAGAGSGCPVLGARVEHRFIKRSGLRLKEKGKGYLSRREDGRHVRARRDLLLSAGSTCYRLMMRDSRRMERFLLERQSSVWRPTRL